MPDHEFYDAMMKRFDAVDIRLERIERRLDETESTQSVLLKAVVKLFNDAHSH